MLLEASRTRYVTLSATHAVSASAENSGRRRDDDYYLIRYRLIRRRRDLFHLHDGTAERDISGNDPTGSILLYSTYLGQNGPGSGGVAVASDGTAYVVGNPARGFRVAAWRG